MFRFAASTALFAALSLPAAAACTGDSYYDLLNDAQRTELAASVATMPYSKGLTWKAKKGADTLTIVGTMHIYDPRLEDLRRKIGPVLESADLLMLEATPEEEAKLQALITQEPERLFIVDGPTLPDQLDEETWQLISAAATQRGIPGFMAAKMQPWYLSLILAVPPCAMSDMTAGVRGLDHMLTQDAQDAGIALQAVEPYTTLFDLFKEQNFDEQIDMLRVNLLSPDLQQQMLVAMLDLYFAQEVGKLWDMSRIAIADMPGVNPAQGEAMFAEMQNALLDRRNQNWIPVIAQATIDNDDIVVAVGAAHLIGDQGILQLLENQGWTITQIP